jgi:sucrose phosphorylase
MFDAVFNHMSVQSDWFQKFLNDESPFHDFFVTVQGAPDLSKVIRPRTLPLLTEFRTAQESRKVWTTFSSDQADLNFKNPKVLLAILEVLLFYVIQGARYIRLDAIAFLWKELGTSCLHLTQTHQIIQLFRIILDRVAPEVLIITETNVPHKDNLSYFGNGHNEAHLIYNFALPPLVLHAIHTGDATTLSNWASSLSTPSSSAFFFNFLASHDGIGLNPVRGLISESEIDAIVKRILANNGLVSYKNNTDGTQSPYELNTTFFSALNNDPSNECLAIDRFMVSQAILLSLIGIPAVYFSSIFGAENDRHAANSSGIARRINRQKYSQQILERELANPKSRAACIYGKYVQMLRVRRSNPAFHPQGRQKVLLLDRRVFGVVRSSPDETRRVICLHNMSTDRVNLKLPTTCGAVLACYPSGKPEQGCLSEVQLGPCQFMWIQTKI